MLAILFIYAGLALAVTIAATVLILCISTGKLKTALERQREDDEQMEYLAELEATRALERDLFATN